MKTQNKLNYSLSPEPLNAVLSLELNGQNKLFGSKVALAYNAWWQQSAQDAFDYRSHADGSLCLPLPKHFSFTTAARYSFENIELLGIKPFDLQWSIAYW